MNGNKKHFLLGSREAAEDVDIDVYPETAPLGAAILGLKEGDTTSYTAPNGKEFSVTVVKIETL